MALCLFSRLSRLPMKLEVSPMGGKRPEPFGFGGVAEYPLSKGLVGVKEVPSGFRSSIVSASHQAPSLIQILSRPTTTSPLLQPLSRIQLSTPSFPSLQPKRE